MLPFDARQSVQHPFDSSPLPKGFERIGPKIIAAPPITLRDLLGGFLPRRYDIELAGESISGLWKEDADRGQKFYEEYADGIFYPFEITHEGNVKEYIVFCPPVTGEGLNGLMYLAAPEKLYGYRTADIINDWNDLYTLPSNEKRRAAHERLPNWYIFAKYRQTILELIMKYHYKRPFNSLEDEVTNSLVPIINWKIGTNGERKWIFEPLTDPTSNAIITHLKVKGVALPSDRQRFVPLLGGLVLAV